MANHRTTPMPWGKFKGYALEDIESSYLVWVLEHADRPAPRLRDAIRAELATRFAPPSAPVRSPQSCPDPTLAQTVVRAGLQSLARKFHPDTGGDTAAMQQLNHVVAWLRQVCQ